MFGGMKHAIAVSTVRHSEFFRRLLDRYARTCRIDIDCSSYGPEDIEKLKATWCTHRKIRNTREFRIRDGERFVASFHDSMDELFVVEEELDWIRKLWEEGIVRYRVIPVAERKSIVSRIKALLGE